MEEDLNIIKSQCGVDHAVAEDLYQKANNDAALAIAIYLKPGYTPPVPSHRSDQFSEIRQVLDEKDAKLQKLLEAKRQQHEEGEEEGVEENKGS